MTCKICGSESAFFADGKILNKYNIKYYKCSNCGFLQTEEPYWLDEAYKNAINRSDVGYVYRNIQLNEITRHLIGTFFNKKGRFLDFGAGYGLFVRLMRDTGFDFYWMDKYCENIFASDFEANVNEKKSFELVTGFELFEHLLNPIPEIETMLSYSDNIFLSTVFHPEGNPKPGNWWYYGEEHGQHISIYSKKTMQFIAKKYNLHLCTNNKNYHLLSKKKKNTFLFNFIIYYSQVKGIKLFPPKSLLDSDYKIVVDRIKANS